MDVQALRPELAVQVDEGVVRRFAGPGDVERDVPVVGPEVFPARQARESFCVLEGEWVSLRSDHDISVGLEVRPGAFVTHRVKDDLYALTSHEFACRNEIGVAGRDNDHAHKFPEGDPPGVAFLYAEGRGAEHASRLLDGFQGTLQVDGYAA